MSIIININAAVRVRNSCVDMLLRLYNDAFSFFRELADAQSEQQTEALPAPACILYFISTRHGFCRRVLPHTARRPHGCKGRPYLHREYILSHPGSWSAGRRP